MSLINFQSALYFCQDADTQQLIARLQSVVPILNHELGIDLRPIDETSAEIIRGNAGLFLENGKQFFLLYSEERPFYDTTEWSLHVSFVDEYRPCVSMIVTPELTEPTKELTNFIWKRLLSITKILVSNMSPLFALINGLDDQSGSQIVSTKTARVGQLPGFMTPYTYLDNSLMDFSGAKALEAAGTYEVKQDGSGWSLQFVEDFYATLPQGVRRALQGLYPSQKVFYKQTPVFEDER